MGKTVDLSAKDDDCDSLDAIGAAEAEAIEESNSSDLMEVHTAPLPVNIGGKRNDLLRRASGGGKAARGRDVHARAARLAAVMRQRKDLVWIGNFDEDRIDAGIEADKGERVARRRRGHRGAAPSNRQRERGQNAASPVDPSCSHIPSRH